MLQHVSGGFVNVNNDNRSAVYIIKFANKSVQIGKRGRVVRCIFICLLFIMNCQNDEVPTLDKTVLYKNYTIRDKTHCEMTTTNPSACQLPPDPRGEVVANNYNGEGIIMFSGNFA